MNVIPTEYRKHYFRSRLEARYAVFWDSLGEKWVYEKEGFDLDGGDKYLPDFWLPRLETWVEIKGVEPDKTEIRKCRKLQFHTEKDVAIFHGLPMENEGLLFGWDESNGGVFTETFAQWAIDDGFLTFTDYPNGTAPEIARAEIRAKSARFEYGASRELESIVDYDKIAF